ncbi:histidine kinase [Rheinheimera texasensis]|uniref:sensor histidine kinase n=1 Tax=Rheinheimera texasensis TaxID=306205 RepID=UPI0032B28946
MPSDAATPIAQSHPPFWRDQLNLIVPCSLLALLFTLFGMGPWWLQLLYSNGIGLTMRSTIRWLQRRFPAQSMTLHTVLALTLAALLWFGLPMGWTYWQFSAAGKAFNPGFDLSLLGIVAVVSVAMTAFYYLLDQKHQLQQQLMQTALKQSEQEKQLLEQQLKLLQSQIEPHFLFNTLANVQALIRLEPQQASQMLAALTTLLRQSLDQTRAQLVPLADELSFSRAYLQIQQIRLGERLQLDWQQSDDLPLQLPVPSVLLQPLLENALQHGIEPVRSGGQLQIRLFVEQQKLCCELRNSLPSVATAQAPEGRQNHGIGLSNTRARLQQRYGGLAGLTLTLADHQAIVRLEIPL